MTAYLRPRRGTSSNNNIVLKEGELYLDTSNSNNTSNSWGRIYIGDNSTTISNLKPFIDYPENMIIHSGISSSGSESSISNGNTLSTIISAIKNVLSTKSSVIKISESDYSNLSTSEKNDPNKVYFRYEAGTSWEGLIALGGETMTGNLTSPGITMIGDINMLSGANINITNGNINITNGTVITPGNDNYGFTTAKDNWGQVGSSSYYWKNGYITSLYCKTIRTQLVEIDNTSPGANWVRVKYFCENLGGYKHIYVVAATQTITVTNTYNKGYFTSLSLPILSSTGWSSSGKVLSMLVRSSDGTGLQFCSVSSWNDTSISFFLTCMRSESTAKVYYIYAHLVV